MNRPLIPKMLLMVCALAAAGCHQPPPVPGPTAGQAPRQPDAVVSPRPPTREEVTSQSILYDLGTPRSANPLPW